MFESLILFGMIFAAGLFTALILRCKQWAAERQAGAFMAGPTMEDLPAGIWYCNAAGRCQSGNRYWRDLASAAGADWHDLGWIEAFAQSKREAIRRDWLHHVVSERPIDVVWQVHESDQPPRWLRIQASPQFGKDGTLQSYFCVATDASAAAGRENALLQRCGSIQQQAEDHAHSLAGMSADLRAPVDGIIQQALQLQEKTSNPRQAREWGAIAKAGHTMITVLDEITEASLDPNGQLDLRPAPVALDEVLHNCVALFEPSALARGIGLDLFIEETIPPLVKLNRARIRQMLSKLLSNAIRSTEEGGIDVEARTEVTSDGTFLLLSVIDTGIGIAADRLEAILTSDHQRAGGNLAHDGVTKYAEHGLSLAKTGQLAKAMDGQLVVHSRAGVGSCFTLRLPLRTSRASPQIAPPEPLPAALPRSTILAGAHVLLVENDEISRHHLATIAARLGIALTCVRSGEDCLLAIEEAQLEGVPYRAVLMDVQLPAIAGFRAARRLRGRGYDPITLPVIALTKDAAPDFAARCQDAGMQSYLTKPVSSLALARELAKFLVPASGIPTVSEAPIGALSLRYSRRKSLVIDVLKASLDNKPEKTDWAVVANELHRLAGIAAQFGESELCEMSRALERSIMRSGNARARQEYLRKAWPALKRVA